MRCAWKELLDILPHRLRMAVDKLGREHLQELRLRINAPPELVLTGGSMWLDDIVTQEDLHFTVNVASRYSPWCARTLAQGYLTAPGGHRIGICGETTLKDGQVSGIRTIHSLCIRIARDFTNLIQDPEELSGNILILGAPGWGKTTLLRDLIRQISHQEQVAVVDERGELFPPGFLNGARLDVLSGCPKGPGIEILLRTMGPDTIAIDEITAKDDCEALVQAANCGVRLAATAHAASKEDFFSREVYSPLVKGKIVDILLLLRQDKTYFLERMTT